MDDKLRLAPEVLDRFRRLDAAIRGNIRKKDEQKEKKLWKKKKPSQA